MFESTTQALLTALAAPDTTLLARKTQLLAQTAVADLPTFQHALDLLAYHGRSAAIAATLEAAWPALQEAEQVDVIRARNELAARATDHLIFAHLEQNATPNPADPQLVARLHTFFDIDAEGLARYFVVVSGRAQQSWQLADFEPAEQSASGTATQNLATLLLEFIAYAYRQASVTYSKSNLLRRLLPTYFAARRTGQLAPRRDFTDLMRGNRPRPDFSQPEAPHPLLPDRTTLEEFIARLLHFARPRPYQAAATYELLPAWLRFLQACGLIDAFQQQQTLRELQGIESQMAAFWREQNSDPALLVAAEKWPNLAP